MQSILRRYQAAHLALQTVANFIKYVEKTGETEFLPGIYSKTVDALHDCYVADAELAAVIVEASR